MTDFEDIRSYRDEEIPAAMSRIADSDYLHYITERVFEGLCLEKLKAQLRQISSIKEFQEQFMLPIFQWIIRNTTDGICYSGYEKLSKDKACLFTGNHRDIVLDASFLQCLLHSIRLDTCEITFGSNLMMNQFIIDIGKSNKMFKVDRSSSMREFIQTSKHLSEYMRKQIKQGTSVWIAQRNGRTKDGDDKTDRGLVSMYFMSGSQQDILENIDELHITPVATSYEFEPCDLLKTRELYISKRDGAYHKKPMEDLNSILTGIRQHKGRVNIHVCQSISKEDLQARSPLDKRSLISAVADIIDQRICQHYQLFPNNYIAIDLLNAKTEYADFYSQEEKAVFEERLAHSIESLRDELGESAEAELRRIFLNIYANPVKNHNRLSL